MRLYKTEYLSKRFNTAVQNKNGTEIIKQKKAADSQITHQIFELWK
jgi:hypothetical protein